MKEVDSKEFNSGEYLYGAININAGVVVEGRLEGIPLGLIGPSPYQSRKIFDKAALEELSNSIKEKGVIEPIIVRVKSDLNSEFKFELVAGERRLRASALAGKTTIPAIIREMSDETAMENSLIENVQREDLNFIETMEAYVSLKGIHKITEEVARVTGKNTRTIQRFLKCNNDISNVPGLMEIFKEQASIVDYTTAETVSKFCENIKQFSKSNKREFERILERFKKKGIKENIPWLKNKFSEVEKTGSKSGTVEYLKETETWASLSIRIDKKNPLDGETKSKMLSAIQSFSGILEEIPGLPEKEPALSEN